MFLKIFLFFCYENDGSIKPARLNGEMTKNRIGREKSIIDESL